MAAWKLVAVACVCAALLHVAIGYIPVVIPDPGKQGICSADNLSYNFSVAA